MAVETTSAGTTITGDSIADLRVLMGIRAMKFEIETGMKMTRGFSGTRFAQEYGYTGPKSLKKAYAWMVESFAPKD